MFLFQIWGPVSCLLFGSADSPVSGTPLPQHDKSSQMSQNPQEMLQIGLVVHGKHHGSCGRYSCALVLLICHEAGPVLSAFVLIHQ